MEKREYVISAPGYHHICHGIRALHYLAHMLNERGYKTYVTGNYTNPEFNAPLVKTLSQDHLRHLQHNGVIVYPDIVPNNPAHFSNCVKYWLGASQPNPVNQLVFSFSSMHDVVHKNNNHLFISHIEEDLFKLPEIENRIDACSYAGKGNGIDHSPVIELTGAGNDYGGIPGCKRIHGGFPPYRGQLAKLLQESTVLYCYDNLTVLMTEARLCGCPVVLMGHWVLPEVDFKERDEYGLEGIGFYGEPYDLEELKSQLPKFIERFNLRKQKTEIELDNFIELTQNWNPENTYVPDQGPFGPNIHGTRELMLWGTR